MATPLSPRQAFRPIKPDSPTVSSSSSHQRAGSVSKLRSQFESPSTSPTKPASSSSSAAPGSPLTSKNLASLQENNDPQSRADQSQPVVRAKVSAAAAPRRKQLPGTEHMNRPLSRQQEPSSYSSSSSATLSSYSSHRLAHQPSLDSVAPLHAKHLDPFVNHSPSALADPFEQSHAAVPSQKDTVAVCVRVKPTQDPSKDAWAVDPNVARVALTQGDRAGTAFNYDGVVSGSGNKAIYEAAAKGLIRQAMQGFDAVVFAYGQTASGKTYTLTGTHSNPGVIPQAVSDIFTYIRANPSQEFLLRASYLEIYNENLKDLLAPETQGLVKMRQDQQKRFFVSPLREEVVTSEAQVAALLLRGEANRHTGTTDFNSRSSRSHTILQIIIESREASDSGSRCQTPSGRREVGPHQSRLAANGGGAVKISRLSLIDLAGSEKATSQAERRVEGAFINKSLLTLEKVVSALTEDKPRAHIPYRDSKLTQILQPSLAGTAKVAVICTFNPASNFIEESKSTLKFATRVKKVTVAAERNEVLDDKALLTKYRNQIVELQAQLAAKSAEAASIPPTPQRAPDDRRSKKESSENKRQAENLRTQIATLQELFLRAENVDKERELNPTTVIPAITQHEATNADGLADKYLDAAERASDLEDQVAKAHATIAELREELSSRPVLPPDAPLDLKDEKIGQLERTIREMEVIIANTDVEDAARRERRFVEREWSSRVRALERDILVRKELEAKSNEVLANERKRAKELEEFIINHLNAEADKLSRRRRSSFGTMGEDDELGFDSGPALPSLMDEPADLDTISASFATVSMGLAQLAGDSEATPTKRMSEIPE